MPDGHAVASGQTHASSQHVQSRYVEAEESQGFGWIVFAGVLIMIAGVVNLVYGIAAIAESSFYVANTQFVFSKLNFWGWVLTCVGLLQLCVAAGIWAQAQWARWTGVIIASLSAIAQLFYLPSYPWLSIAVFTLDVLVIYGLVAYGGRMETYDG
jgi:Predicted membrane protein (DUF2127)